MHPADRATGRPGQPLPRAVAAAGGSVASALRQRRLEVQGVQWLGWDQEEGRKQHHVKGCHERSPPLAKGGKNCCMHSKKHSTEVAQVTTVA
jgi:hypothetical protein